MCVLAFSMRRVLAADRRLSLSIVSSCSSECGRLDDRRSLSSSSGLWDPMKEFAGKVTLNLGRLARIRSPFV